MEIVDETEYHAHIVNHENSRLLEIVDDFTVVLSYNDQAVLVAIATYEGEEGINKGLFVIRHPLDRQTPETVDIGSRS